MVREEQALTCVKRAYLSHFFLSQAEIEHVEILLHTFNMRGLRNYHNIALDKETQSRLSNALAVFFADLLENGIVEIVVFALCKRAPAFYLSAVLLHVLICFTLLLKNMSLYLINSRLDLCKMLNIKVSVRIEVGNAYRYSLS